MDQPRMDFALDVGQGQVIDFELGDGGRLWIALGSGFKEADVWMRSADTTTDLRVRLRREGNRIEIVVDRGDGQTNWWNNRDVPRLAIVLDPKNGTATAAASAGSGAEFQQVILGQTRI